MSVCVLLFLLAVAPASEAGDLPRDCLYACSGVQTIQVGKTPIQAYCDQTTDGGGWTVILRRQDGSEDFYKDWKQYEDGFGNLNGEFWLGLRNIHKMTKKGNYSLRVDLWDKDDTYVFAQYSSFSIDGPADNYRLHLGTYSGTAGDSMVDKSNGDGIVNNMVFSTHDKDNDLAERNCASSHHGAWWYNACHHSQLTGRYKPDGKAGEDGIVWLKYKDDWRSFLKAEMKIKPVIKCD